MWVCLALQLDDWEWSNRTSFDPHIVTMATHTFLNGRPPRFCLFSVDYHDVVLSSRRLLPSFMWECANLRTLGARSCLGTSWTTLACWFKQSMYWEMYKLSPCQPYFMFMWFEPCPCTSACLCGLKFLYKCLLSEVYLRHIFVCFDLHSRHTSTMPVWCTFCPCQFFVVGGLTCHTSAWSEMWTLFSNNTTS